MTREEYKQKIVRRWPHACISNQSFPETLTDIGLQCFIEQDITSDLAKETRRRLLQLKDTGITDP